MRADSGAGMVAVWRDKPSRGHAMIEGFAASENPRRAGKVEQRPIDVLVIAVCAPGSAFSGEALASPHDPALRDGSPHDGGRSADVRGHRAVIAPHGRHQRGLAAGQG